MPLMVAAKNKTLSPGQRMMLQRGINAAARVVGMTPGLPLVWAPVAVAIYVVESHFGALQARDHTYFRLPPREGDRVAHVTESTIIHGVRQEVPRQVRQYTATRDAFQGLGEWMLEQQGEMLRRAASPVALAHAMGPVLQPGEPGYGYRLETVMHQRGLLQTFGFPYVA